MKRKMGVARDIRLYGIPIQEQFSFKTAEHDQLKLTKLWGLFTLFGELGSESDFVERTRTGKWLALLHVQLTPFHASG
jgi:hypothetical protein